MLAMSGRNIAALMRQHKLTIRDVAQKLGCTLSRVRHVRNAGVSGFHAIDWREAITGVKPTSEEIEAAWQHHHAQAGPRTAQSLRSSTP